MEIREHGFSYVTGDLQRANRPIVYSDAIDSGNPSIIQLLLDAGADVNRQEEGELNYGCALGYAVERENLGLVQQLLDLGRIGASARSA